MDIAFYSKEEDKVIIANGKGIDLEDYPEDKYTPIGVVVIPKSHNVYGDGTCGIMSICEMNCGTPQQGGGTAYQSMYWGVDGKDISSLPNLNQVPIVSNGSSVYSTVQSQDSRGWLPSTIFSQTKNPYDISYYYYTNYNSFLPSPYLTDGSRNPSYYQTSAPSSTANALADFDGRGNTSKIIAQRGVKDYTTWKPNATTQADYPAASCCDMFSTVGTEQGDWYLPSCGEFGYIIVRLKEINEALNKLKVAYPNVPLVGLNTNDYYWSSSEYGSYITYYLSTSNGYVYYFNKNRRYYVRALLRVKS